MVDIYGHLVISCQQLAMLSKDIVASYIESQMQKALKK